MEPREPPGRIDVDAVTERDRAEPGGEASATAIGARYQLGEAIGRGGMGEVVAARDLQLGREVAVKRLRLPAGVAADPATVARFTREARVQGRLDHPAIVPVHELGVDDAGRPFFVMKRLHGHTLAELLALQRRGDAAALERAPRHTLLAAFGSVCLAVHFAHERGVIHRDLKPANIVLGEFGEVWVIDWGVAKLRGEPDDPAAPSGRARTRQSDVALTEDDSVLGTPGYMPPEQLHGAALDGRADVYALGCILFELLAREPLHPVGRVAIGSTLAGVDARPSARRPDLDLPPELDALCVRATARRVDDRYPSARALHDALERYLAGDRDLERRRELAARHLAAAHTALDGDDAIESRRLAMREAGRALALVPDDRHAGALVTRLLLEPPRVVPAEVERDLEVERDRRSRSLVRLIVSTYASYILFVPLVVWMGLRRWEPLAVFGALWMIAGGNALWFSRRGVPRWGPWVLMLLSAAMISLVGQIFGVLLIAPVIAVSGASVMALHPYAPSRLGTLAVYATASLGPLLLEQLGVIPSTLRFLDDRIEITSRAVAFPPLATGLTLAAMIFAALILVSRLMARTRILVEDDARRRALGAWQLAQLVGGEPPPST